MATRNRILAGIFVVFAAGIAYLLHVIIADLEPRYREAAEEPLVDISRVLAAMIETDVREGRIDPQRLRAAFTHVYRQRFAARVYALEKSSVDLRVYVTDRNGRVVFDSQGRGEGKDYSQWRDVLLTLRGEYGARTTRDTAGDPGSSVMFVAAPVVWNGEIAGVLSVGKPTANLNAFARLAQRKIIVAGVTAVAGLMGLALLAAIWLTRPFGLVRDYLRLVRDARRMPFPRLRRSAVGVLGAAYDEMRDALAGRNYVEEYVQTLTHELKSPLSGIRAAAELLEEDMPAQSRARFLGNIRAETERIQTIVDRLLELAAIEKRRGLADVRAIPLEELVAEAMAATESAAARRGVKVRFEGTPGLALAGDRFLLHRALVNLLQNAIDFSPPGGAVHIAARAAGQDCEIGILDDGPGIPDYARAKVFERFYSLPRPATGKKSTGLGLSFVKEIVELHRGSVTLDNRPEGGLAAHLRLPLALVAASR